MVSKLMSTVAPRTFKKALPLTYNFGLPSPRVSSGDFGVPSSLTSKETLNR
jgi:hypothetical protein